MPASLRRLAALAVAGAAAATATAAGDPSPPPSWAPAIAALDMLWAPSDSGVSPNSMPIVGNGFLATQVMTDWVKVAGLYNGFLTQDPSHRVRVPATNAIAAPGTPGPAALNVREATYYRRSFIAPQPAGAPCTTAATASCTNASGGVWVEQRWYAHRALPSLMVHEVQVIGADAASVGAEGDDAAAAATAATPAAAGGATSGGDPAYPYAMLRLVNNPGSNSSDLNVSSVATPPGCGYSLITASTKVAEVTNGSLQALAVLTTDLPPAAAANMLPVPAGSGSGGANAATFAFLTVIRTSIETSPAGPADLAAAATADYAAAQAMIAAGTLHASHVAEWAETVWPAGFECDRRDFAGAVNTSLYALLSSIRPDRPFSLSPGGLSPGYK
jgi:hypothetical protein